MKTIYSIIIAAVLLALPAFAQSTIPTTTLAAALTDSSSTSVTLASTAGFVQNSVGQYTTGLYVDTEYMLVRLLTASTAKVQRGASGTRATKHNSGAIVYVGPPNWFGGSASSGNNSGGKAGSCAGTEVQALPWININTGDIFTCLSSFQWIKIGTGGTMGSAPSQLIARFCSGTVATGETEFLNDAACAAATTATASSLVVSPGTVYGLRASSSANVTGGTGKDVLTVFKNGVATAVTCTIAAGTKACSDLTHSVAVVPGDAITYQFVAATSDTAANVSASAEKN